MRRSAALALLLVNWACSVERIVTPAQFACGFGGACDASTGRRDSGASDGATPVDSGDSARDTGTPRPDAGPDASQLADGGDAAELDASDLDAEPGDVVPGMDVTPDDAGALDAQPGDALPGDARPVDSGPRDTGVHADAGPRDTGVPGDTGLRDTGVPDSGVGRPLGSQCTFDADCASSYCLSFTAGGTPYTLCSDPCSAATQCPLGFGCVDVAGMGFCLRGFNGQLFSVAPGGFCDSSTNDCQSGWCLTNRMQCLESCTREADCALYGGNCLSYVRSSTPTFDTDGLCVSLGTATATIGGVCSSDAQCRTGVCDRATGRCAAHCCSNRDCAARDNCVIHEIGPSEPIRICRRRGGGSGSLPLGSSCSSAAQCASGICIRDPANPGAPLKCSTYCCTNADCAGALPLGGRCRAFQNPLVPSSIVGQCVPN